MKETLIMGTTKESALPVIPKDCLLPEAASPSLRLHQLHSIPGPRTGAICDLCLPVQDEISSITEKTNVETFTAIQQNNFV